MKVGEALQSFATDISPETSPIGRSSNFQDSIFEQSFLAASTFRNDQSTQLSIGPGPRSSQRQANPSKTASSRKQSRLAEEFLGQLEVVYKNSVRDGVFSDLTIMLEKASSTGISSQVVVGVQIIGVRVPGNFSRVCATFCFHHY